MKQLREVHLHLGAHRTGSTAFQMVLSANATALHAQGLRLGFPERSRVPNGQLRTHLDHAALGDPKQLKKQIAKNRADLAPVLNTDEYHQALLSEENFIGGMISFEQGRFYPNVRERMILLRMVLHPAEIGNVMLMIRSYDSLFESAFRKRAETHVMPSYEAVRHRQAEFEGGWPTVVEAILAELKPQKLLVVPYRRERDDLALLELLCPHLGLAGLTPSEGYTNMSFPDAALFEIQRQRRAGKKLFWDEKRAIYDAFADKVAERPFVQLYPDHAENLRARYLSDLELLRRRSDVTLVEE
ncbi:hypothetical protein [Aliiroseovarius sp. PrR006]|uniref:hypothetical protein n=1 Tax=Aliiroseovarius sp. PrR006 TaxID=2706883 RepID=UPI0013CF9CA8|nr:hypothetical protein [Aliiroseovarius sp. PrR006]NDW52380.1 hypothetical protein [Aliiroseovarius sp. PrR006]